MRAALMSVALLFTCQISAQNQLVADSLIQIYQLGAYTPQDELEIISEIAENETSPKLAIYYANILYKRAQELGDLSNQYMALNYMGSNYRVIGSYNRAVDYYYKCIELAKTMEDDEKLSYAYGSLGNLYANLEDYKNTIKYYKKSLNLSIQNADTNTLALNYYNIGNAYYQQNEYDSTKEYYKKVSALAEFTSFEDILKVYTTGDIALIHLNTEEEEIGKTDIQKVLQYLKEIGDSYGLAIYYRELSNIYEDQGLVRDAIDASIESLYYSEMGGYQQQVMRSCLRLSALYDKVGNAEESNDFYKRYIANRDSVENLQVVQRIADLRTEFEVGQKQAELDVITAQQKTERVIMIGITALAFILIILAVIIYKYYQSKARLSAILENQNQILEKQKSELQSLNETKDKFFSIISHDLRGPISSFFGISRMIKYMAGAKQTDQLVELADDIDDSVSQLSSLLDNLLSWATQQRGHIPYTPEKIDVSNLAGDLVRTLTNMAKAKDIELSSEVEPGLAAWADRNTTMTIVRNLVNNSLKFTPEGGRVKLIASFSGDVAEIRISDTGVGMPQEKVDILFDLQAKKSTYGTSGEKGLGLGLQLVKEFVELNQGDIQVESEEGEGTTFIVKLPLYNTELNPDPQEQLIGSIKV